MSLKRPLTVIETDGGMRRPPTFSLDAAQEVFERIGGVDRLAQMADENPKWYYEKIWRQTIQVEKVEVTREKTVAELLSELDAKMQNVTPMMLEGEADGPETE